MAKIKSKTILGEVTPSQWAQVFEKGDLTLIAEITGKNASKEGALFTESVEKKLKRLNPKNVAEFKEVLSPLIKKHPDVSFVAGFISGKRMYVLISGDGALFISRNKTLLPVLTHSGSASSELVSGDVVILMSEACCRQVPDAFLQEIIMSADTLAMYELFTTTQRARHEHVYGAAALIEIALDTAAAVVPLKEITSTDRAKLTARSSFTHIKDILYAKRLLLAVVVLLVALGAGSFTFFTKYQLSSQEERRFRQQVEVVKTLFNEGVATIATNPLRARTLISDAKAQLEGQLATASSDRQKKEIGMVLSAVSSGLENAKRKYETPLSTFYDLSLLKPEAVGVRWDLYQDTFVIEDIHNELLYRLSASTKAGKILARSSILQAGRGVSIDGEDIYVLSDSVYKLKIEDGSLNPIFPPDPDWGSVSAIKIYGGNIYLLDVGKNWVWKYYADETDNGFGPRQDYFLFDTIVNLQGATSLGVDGYVWIGMNGSLKRFSSGREDVWRINGLEESLGGKLSVSSSEHNEFLYILDHEHARVIQLTREGEYLAQYHWSSDVPISDFAVSEPLKKIFLLAGATIYSIDLK